MNTIAITDFPKIKDRYAIGFVALSTVIMAYSYLLNIIPILVFYMIWMAHILLGRQFVLRPGRDIVLPALFAGYCLFTIFWSDYPRSTLIMSLEFASMIVCTAIMTRTVTFSALLKGLSLGVFLVLIITFRTGSFSFSGLFGSKNQVGFYAEIGIFTAGFLFFHLRGRAWQALIFTLPVFFLSAACLALSSSASSLVSLLVSVAVCMAVGLAAAAPRGLGSVVIGLMIFAAATVAVAMAAFQIDVQGEILESLGKDPTLTGRTWLWEQGVEIGMSKLVLGHGYAGFWVPGQADAERMWQEFHIHKKTGFHFHNIFIQTFVDLGLIGLVMMVLMAVGSVSMMIVRTLKEGANAENLFLLGLAVMFLVRSFAEVDVLGPFGIGVLLFYFIQGRIWLRQPVK